MPTTNHLICLLICNGTSLKKPTFEFSIKVGKKTIIYKDHEIDNFFEII